MPFPSRAGVYETLATHPEKLTPQVVKAVVRAAVEAAKPKRTPKPAPAGEPATDPLVEIRHTLHAVGAALTAMSGEAAVYLTMSRNRLMGFSQQLRLAAKKL